MGIKSDWRIEEITRASKERLLVYSIRHIKGMLLLSLISRDGTVATSLTLPLDLKTERFFLSASVIFLRRNPFYKLVQRCFSVELSLGRKSPLVSRGLRHSPSTPLTCLTCGSLLFKTDTLVNNSFLHLPPSFSSDYFLVSWPFLIEVFRSPSKAEPLFADKQSSLWMEINCTSHTSVSNLLS